MYKRDTYLADSQARRQTSRKPHSGSPSQSRSMSTLRASEHNLCANLEGCQGFFVDGERRVDKSTPRTCCREHRKICNATCAISNATNVNPSRILTRSGAGEGSFLLSPISSFNKNTSFDVASAIDSTMQLGERRAERPTTTGLMSSSLRATSPACWGRKWRTLIVEGDVDMRFCSMESITIVGEVQGANGMQETTLGPTKALVCAAPRTRGCDHKENRR